MFDSCYLDMILCISCKIRKDESQFRLRSKSKGQRHTTCKKCRSEFNKKYYRESPNRKTLVRKTFNERLKSRKSYVLEYLKNHPCGDCGETDTTVLEFDHLRDKEHDISDLKRGASLKRLQGEINKCEVRCANCHRKVTHRRRVLASSSSLVERTPEKG